MKKITEETELKFKNYSQLSFKDTGKKDVEIFIDGESVGKSKVLIDDENDNREYVIINYEVIYLDTIDYI